MNIRDSLTGRYISLEEANKLTPERYEVEASEPTDNVALEEILEELCANARKLPNVSFVNIEDIKAIFQRYGIGEASC
jgi:hypothetical protein